MQPYHGNATHITPELSGRCLADIRAFVFEGLEELIEYLILACGSRRHNNQGRRSAVRTT